MRTIYSLLDTAPVGLEERIKDVVSSIPDVSDCHHVRLRSSGPYFFVDVHVLIDGDKTLKEAHLLTEKIELKIQEMLPNADVTVHPEPRP